MSLYYTVIKINLKKKKHPPSLLISSYVFFMNKKYIQSNDRTGLYKQA